MQVIERKCPVQNKKNLIDAGIPPLIASLFAARGVSSAQDADINLDKLIPYFELKNARAMAEELANAISANKHLVIVADYDADGATACAIAVRALSSFGANVSFMVPNRLIQGYGLTPSIVDDVLKLSPKPDIIVTVDNGIASHEGIDYARANNIKVLVTDHHLPAKTLPNAELIVNPNQPGCTFPSKALAGCGVIYYVMKALEDVLSSRKSTLPLPSFQVDSLLPIVAIGTIADVVGLDSNNRRLVANGLSAIRDGNCQVGILALIEISGKTRLTLSTSDIAFAIAPRINAAGRLESMREGIECLTTDNNSKAFEVAKNLNGINESRREIEGEIVTEAIDALVSSITHSKFSTVLCADHWHHGVIGVVAGRIKEQTWRPTFILAKGHGEELRGSGRSIPGFHLRNALDLVSKRAPGLLIKFGGHAMAAGVSISSSRLEEFTKLFEEVAIELISPAMLNQVVEVDEQLSINDLSIDSVALIKRYVWGQQFPEPLFCDTFEVIESRLIGDGKHLKLTLKKDGKFFSAVKFRHTQNISSPEIRACFRMDANEYKGRTNFQLIIEHIM